MEMERLVNRGDIYYLDFGRTVGSEQNGIRPVLILQNDVGNKYSPTVIIAAITAQFSKKELPTHVELDFRKCGLTKRSQVLLECVNTKDKSRLGDYIGRVDIETMEKINEAVELSISVGRSENIYERHEIKITKEKVKCINELERFIKRWVSFGRDISLIKEDMLEREARLKDLERYTKSYGLNYKEFYKPVTVERMENLNVMVG